MKKTRRIARLRPVAIVLAVSATLDSARAEFWNVAAGNWDTPTNWNPASVPNGTQAIFSNGGTATINTAVARPSPIEVQLGQGTTGVTPNVGRLDILAGSLDVNAAGAFTAGRDGGEGHLNIADTTAASGGVSGFGLGSGSLSTGALFGIGGTLDAGLNPHPGTGFFNVNTSGTITSADVGVGVGPGSHGTVNFQNGLWNISGGQGLGIGVIGGVGTANIAGGNVNVTNNLAVGYDAGTGLAGTGTLNIADTSVASAGITGFGMGTASLSSGDVYIGGVGGLGNGTLNINTSGIVQSATVRVGNGGQGTVRLENGTWNNNGMQVGIGGGAPSSLTMSGGTINSGSNIAIGTGAGASGHMTVTGGTVNVNNSQSFQVGNNGGAGILDVGGSGALNALNLQAGVNGGSDGTINVTGGNLTVTGGGVANGAGLFVAGAQAGNAHGTFNLSNGATATVAGLYAGGGVGSVGTINITNGTLMHNDWGEIGRDGGTGTLNIDGPNAHFVHAPASSDFHIGRTGGTGYLNIKNGGTWNHNWWIVLTRQDGAGTPGYGEVNVDGAGSTLTQTTGRIVVGEEGLGVMNVTHGGSVVHNSGEVSNIGGRTGGVGILNVTGVGSSYVHTGGGETWIGGNDWGGATPAQGTVNITAGGYMQVTGRIRTGWNGATGKINIDGAGSKLEDLGNIDANIGDGEGGVPGGHGELNITNGGQFLFGQWMNVARGAGTTGTVNVDGAGSTLTVGGAYNGEFNVGEDGMGFLNITNGAKVYHQSAGNGESSQFNVGRNAGGIGIVNVSGPGSELNVNAWFRIGGQSNGAKGTVTVDDGGKLVVGGQLRVGNYGEGTLNALGDSTLIIGNGAQNHYVGTHNFPNQGNFNIADNALVQFGNGSYMEVGWAAFNENAVGNGVVSQSGGLITSVSDPIGDGSAALGDYLGFELGRGGGSMGAFNMSAGKALFRSLVVGRRGSGTLNLSGGDLIVRQADTGGPGRVELGEEPGGSGLMNITGGTINHQDWFNVGANGSTGTLNIAHSNPAYVVSSRDLYVGYGGGAVGTINITSGNLRTDNYVEIGRGNGGTGTINVVGMQWNRGVEPGAGNRENTMIGIGASSVGNVNVTDGGSYTTNWWFRLGVSAGSATGHVVVDGPGSAINVINPVGTLNGVDNNVQVNIGEAGVGTLSITNGATFNHMQGFGGGEFYLGRDPGSDGTVTVAGAGSQLNSNAREFRVGHNGSTGTLNIVDGAVVNFASRDESNTAVSGNFGIAQHNNAVGRINMDHGTLNISAWSLFSAWEDSSPNSVAELNMVESSVNLPNDTGDHGRLLWDRRGQATINQSGGVFHAANWAVLGVEAGGRGYWNMSDAATAQLDNELNVGRAGGTGVVSASGVGTNLNVTGEVFIGRDGGGANGTLNLIDGAHGQFNNNLAIGQGGGGSTGLVNVQGAGTMLTVNGWTTLGRDTGNVLQTSELNVSDGAVFTHPATGGGDFLLGWQNGSVARVNVTSGGTLNYNHWVRIGVDPGSMGTLTIDGPGSSFNNTTGNTRIGESGVGILNVTNGGLYNMIPGGTDRDFIVGVNGGSDGTVNISTGGKINTQGWAYIGLGNGAHGRVNMDGGEFNSADWIVVGNDTGSEGAFNLNDGTVNSPGAFFTGRFGHGTFNQTGGTLVTNGWSLIGSDAGGHGDYNLSGGVWTHKTDNLIIGRVAKANNPGDPGSTFTVSGTGFYHHLSGGLFVGNERHGYGTLNVLENGVVDNKGGEINVAQGSGNPDANGNGGGAPQGFLNVSDNGVVLGNIISIGRGWGADPGGSPYQAVGVMNMSGGSVVSNNWLSVGHEGGNGTLNLTGGTLKGTSEFLVGIDQNGAPTPTEGVVNMSDGLLIGGNISIGRSGGHGVMSVTGGKVQDNNELNLAGGGGVADLNITGGTFNVDGWTTIGRDGGSGTGNINVSDTGVFTHNQTGGDLLLGWTNGSHGTINVINGGRMTYNWWTRLAIEPGAFGTLNVDGPGSRFDQAVLTDTRFAVGEGGTGVLTVSNGGAVTAANGLGIGWDADGNDANNGTMSIAGGSVRVTGEFNVAYNQASTGIATLDGGILSSTSYFIVGRAGHATYTQSAGRAWNIDNDARVGNDASGVGTFNLAGGLFHAGASAMIGEAGTGTLNVTDGTFALGCDAGTLFIGHLNGSSGVVNVTGGLVLADAGSVEFNSQGGAVTATLNANGGTIATNFFNNPTGNGIAQMNMSGVTFRASGDQADFIRGFSTAQLNVDAGGLTIDTNDHTVGLNAVLGGAGGLAKSGFGRLDLNNNQAYAGDTTVSSGILSLNFANAANPSNIVPVSGLYLNGGTLAVNGGFGPANSQSFTNTFISPGASAISTQQNGAPSLNIALGGLGRATAGGTVDLTLPATGSISTTTGNTNGILGGYLTVGNTTWGTSSAGNIVGLADVSYDAVFGAAANFDTLKAGGGIAAGGAVNSIRFGRAAADTITLTAPTNVGSGGILVSSNVGANNSIITGSTITSGGSDLVVLQNSGGTLTINSQINGGIALTKSGTGTLVLSNNANTYTGGTYINAGTLQISSDGALGGLNGPVTMAASSFATGGVLHTTATMTLAGTRALTLNSGGGGFQVDGGTTLTLPQSISGAGGLAKLGAGTLILGGNSTYTGATAIYQGDLQVTGSILGTSGFLAGGNISLQPGSSIVSSGPFTVADAAGSVVNVNVAGPASIQAGDVVIGASGAGTVTLTNGGNLIGTCDMFVGQHNGASGVITATGASGVYADRSLFIGNDGGSTGSVSVTDGVLSVGNELRVGASGEGLLTLAGATMGEFRTMDVAGGAPGTVNVGGTSSLAGNGYINLGSANSAPALFNQTGGTVSYNQWMTIGIGAGPNDPNNSKYMISGGKLTSAAGLELGSDHGGTLDISGTGAVSVGTIEIGTFGDRGNGTAGNGVLNISGNGTLTSPEIQVGANRNNGGTVATGVMNQTGGTTTVNGILWVTRNGNTSGTLNLSGGSLSTNQIAHGAGVASLNFNGTTIKPNGNQANFISNFDQASSEVLPGGAIFDTNGHDIGIVTSLDGPGALTKNGDGTLTLRGNSSYAGGVNLNQGTISVRSSTAFGTGTVVGNGGRLSFDNNSGVGLLEGKVSSTDAFDQTNPIPGNATTLSTPRANSTDTALFWAPQGAPPATWGYRGTLVVPTGGATWTFAENFDDNVLLLVDGTPVLNNNAWNTPTKGTVSLTGGDHSFELRLGDGGGGVGPSNQGWLNNGIGFGYDPLGRDTEDASFFQIMTDPGDGSLFKYNDDGGVNYTIANQFSLLQTTEVFVKQFSATLNGSINGPAGLNKTGAGTLVLGGANNYAGGTTIAAGVLSVGNGGADGTLGSGPVSNAGTLQFNRSGTLTVPGAISGTGPVQQIGVGTTILTAVNTYTGPTTVTNGALIINGSISGSTTTVTGGVLGGTGVLGPVNVLGAGVIAPGSSVGTMTTGDLAITTGTYSAEVASSGVNDRINVVGSVTLGGTLSTLFGGGPFALNDVFPLIVNDGNDAVFGTFAGLPEGAYVGSAGAGPYNFFITYVANADGGTVGNDVALIIPEPGSTVMLFGGLAALAAFRRRRKA